MKRKLLLILTAICLCITGCSQTGTPSAGIIESSTFEEILKDLTEDTYYVVNNGQFCAPLYIGHGTFEVGETSTSPSDDRVLWFKEDWEQIPTVYAGDMIIFYSESELDEEFIFERFEDFGYTIGVRGLKLTPSGRYRISTKAESMTTYPESDTDVILYYQQENVILDKIGNIELRSENISRCGTIMNLVKDATYPVEIYEGTVLSQQAFKADVRVLGSMETYVSYDFEFINEKIIKITIPTFFNSGYYCINGIGLFRYVAGNSYNDNTNFNVPNEEVSDSENNTGSGFDWIKDVISGNYDDYEDYNSENSGSGVIIEQDTEIYTNEFDDVKTNFEVTDLQEYKVEVLTKGNKQIYAEVFINEDVPFDAEFTNVYMLVEGPDGELYKTVSTDYQEWYCYIESAKEGIYTVKFYNLTEHRSVSINIWDLE